MSLKVYNFKLSLDWALTNLLTKIEQFNTNWVYISSQEAQILQQLKYVATVGSVGSSTRIEGAKMTDDEIDFLLKNIDISKLKDRDSQEVVGYYEALEMIISAYPDIEINESTIKHLHNILMRHSTKDAWHKGNYKIHANSIQAIYPDGTTQLIFQTTASGYETEEAMQQLINWYHADKETPNLVKCAVFTYEFLSIHPFQDGNGRLSRLISILLLLKHNYNWLQYVSFEHEIEKRKAEYYQALRTCQAQRPNEDISVWIGFFLDALKNIQLKLSLKIEQNQQKIELSPKEKTIVAFIAYQPNSQSAEIAEKLKIPLPTVKKILADLVRKGVIKKYGQNKSTSYALN
jgi:Fic family protein